MTAPPGRVAALAYLRIPPEHIEERRQLLEQTAAETAQLAEMILALVDLVEDVALTDSGPAFWDAYLQEQLSGVSATGISSTEYSGRKRALALLIDREAPREARRAMAHGAAQGLGRIVVVVLTAFLDRFHAVDPSAWATRLDERLAALSTDSSITKES